MLIIYFKIDLQYIIRQTFVQNAIFVQNILQKSGKIYKKYLHLTINVVKLPCFERIKINL